MQAQSQLVEGFCAAVERKGYAATTIADIVRHAKVSKRTFYERFADKEACFLAAYAEISEEVLSAMLGAVDVEAPWLEQVDAAVRSYLAVLEARPALTRSMFLEIHAAGARALRLRRQVLERFADFTRQLVDAGRTRHTGLRSLSPTMAMALVGGINELVLLKVEAGASHRLADVADTAVELVHAVLAAEPPALGRGGSPRRAGPPRLR